MLNFAQYCSNLLVACDADQRAKATEVSAFRSRFIFNGTCFVSGYSCRRSSVYWQIKIMFSAMDLLSSSATKSSAADCQAHCSGRVVGRSNLRRMAAVATSHHCAACFDPSHISHLVEACIRAQTYATRRFSGSLSALKHSSTCCHGPVVHCCQADEVGRGVSCTGLSSFEKAKLSALERFFCAQFPRQTGCSIGESSVPCFATCSAQQSAHQQSCLLFAATKNEPRPRIPNMGTVHCAVFPPCCTTGSVTIACPSWAGRGRRPRASQARHGGAFHPPCARIRVPMATQRPPTREISQCAARVLAGEQRLPPSAKCPAAALFLCIRTRRQKCTFAWRPLPCKHCCSMRATMEALSQSWAPHQLPRSVRCQLCASFWVCGHFTSPMCRAMGAARSAVGLEACNKNRRRTPHKDPAAASQVAMHATPEGSLHTRPSPAPDGWVGGRPLEPACICM